MYITGIDPLYAIGSGVSATQPKTKAEAQKEFVAMFLNEILKEVYKGQSSMFGDEGSLGAFSDNMYNDLFIAKVSNELANSKAFGFESMFKS